MGKYNEELVKPACCWRAGAAAKLKGARVKFSGSNAS
jgi:hypothetical protein